MGIVSSAEPARIIINSGSTNLSTNSTNNQPSVIRKLSPSEVLEKGLASSTRGTIENGKPQQPSGGSKRPGISAATEDLPPSTLENWPGIPCPPGTAPGKVVQQAFFTDEYGTWYEFLWFDCVPIGQGGTTRGGTGHRGGGGTDKGPGGSLESGAGRGTNLSGPGGNPGGGISTPGGYTGPTSGTGGGGTRSGGDNSNGVPLHGVDGGRGLGIVQDGRRPRIGIIRNFADEISAKYGEFVDYRLPEDGEEEEKIIVNFMDDEGTEECSPEFKELVKKVMQDIYDNLIPCLEKYGGALVELAKKMRESIDTIGVNIVCGSDQYCSRKNVRIQRLNHSVFIYAIKMVKNFQKMN